MLTFRPIILVFLLLGLPLAIGLLYPFDSNLKLIAVFSSVLVAVTLARGALYAPLRSLHFFKRFAKTQGYQFAGTLSHEPVIQGEIGGQRFIAGVSAHIASNQGSRYRTVISSPIDLGVPHGLRIYAIDSMTWTHGQSGKNKVSTGLAEVHDTLICEGFVAEEVNAFIHFSERKERILEFFKRHPDTLIHGGSDELPAEPGGASGVVSVAVVDRIRDDELLRQIIEDTCELARELSAASGN